MEAEFAQYFLDLVFKVPGLEGIHFFKELGHLIRVVYAAFGIEHGLVVGFDDLEDFRITLVKDRLVNAQVAFEHRILVHIGNFDRLVEGHLTCIGDFLSHDDLHQGGLPCPVDAHKGYFLSLGNAEGDVGKKFALPKGFAEVLNG